MRRILIEWAISLGAMAALVSAVHAQTPQTRTPDGDWTTYNRTYSGERFSPLKEITAENVSKLSPVCTYDTGETVSFQTGPLVVNGVMYFTTFKNTYAIDAGTCALKWKHKMAFESPAKGLVLNVNRGLGYAEKRD